MNTLSICIHLPLFSGTTLLALHTLAKKERNIVTRVNLTTKWILSAKRCILMYVVYGKLIG